MSTSRRRSSLNNGIKPVTRRRANSIQSVENLVDAMRTKCATKPTLSIMTEFITIKPISLRFSRQSLERAYRLEHAKRFFPRYKPLMLGLALVSILISIPNFTKGLFKLVAMQLAIAGLAFAYILLAKQIYHNERILVVSSALLCILVLCARIVSEDTQDHSIAFVWADSSASITAILLLQVALGFCIGLRFLASLQISFILLLVSIITMWCTTHTAEPDTKYDATTISIVGYVFVNLVLLRLIEIHERKEYRLIKRLAAENVHVQLQMENFEIFSKATTNNDVARVSLVTPNSMVTRGSKISASDVELLAIIGSGSHGEVLRGRFKATDVAVKKIRGDVKDEFIQAIGIESTLMAELRHPNIVMFMGMCFYPPMIIMEYCSRGSLFETIHIKNMELDWSLIIRILMDTAHGMTFLHQHKPPIIHHDLKSLNLLLEENWRCKVSDFGLSQFTQKMLASPVSHEDLNMAKSNSVGSIPWMAPEVINSDTVTPKIDVYSFGIILFECLMKKMPYQQLPMHGIPYLISNGQRPTDYDQIEHIPEDLNLLVSLMTMCWSQNPTDRPDFETIVNILEQQLCPKYFKTVSIADGVVIPRELTKAQKDQIIYTKNLCFNINAADLEMGKKIGHGSYGSVFAGKWLGTDVAIKQILLQSLSDRILKEFQKECDLMRQLRHPNIVLFIGSSAQPPNLTLVTELLHKGSLFDIYHAEPRCNYLGQHYCLVIRVAIEMARGMAYLHSLQPPLIHRDLKSPNIMVDAHWVSKIGDFGLSRIKDETKTMTKCGSPLWVAPEILQGHRFAEGCDIYSFGVIVWEVMAWSEPYPGMSSKEVMKQVATNNLRPTIPEGCPLDLQTLLFQCWQNKPEDRPPFTHILNSLEHIEAMHSPDD